MLRVPTIVTTGLLALLVGLSASAWPSATVAGMGNDAPAVAEKPEGADRRSEPAGMPPEAPATPPVLSVPERVSRLQRTIAVEQHRLSELRKRLADQKSEFEAAGQAYRTVEEQIESKTAQVLERKEADDAEGLARAEAELAELKARRGLARERFDLAIEASNVTNERIAAARQKIESDTRALDQLLGKTEPKPGTTPAPAEPPSVPSPPGAEVPTPGTPLPTMPLGTMPSPETAAPGQVETAPVALPPAAKPESAEVVEARKRAAQLEKAAKRAESDASQAKDRLESLETNLRLEREALAATERQVENAQRELDLLEEDLSAKLADETTSIAVVQAVRKRIREAQRRVDKASADRRERLVLLERMQADRAELLAEQLALLRQADAERRRADAAREQLETLENPFTVRNLTRWFLEHGPRLLGIVVIATLLQLGVRLIGHRIVRLLAGSHGRGSRPERENRGRTLISVFENTATVIIGVGALLMLLDEAGIPVVPLLGGAAVVGLAVAFGAQNLIRDFFYGFMILLENQYGVNDIVRICDLTGTVERITLRMTVLRDLDGTVHFVPHGQISTVSNMTHGWSRAVLEIRIAYKEDPDRVMDLLLEIGREMLTDLEFGPLVLDNPEMLGVDSLGESAIVIKFFIKTRPTQQWAVKREMLRRIKQRFAEEGIEIPFPHRTVYHRTEDATGPSLEIESFGR